MQNKTKISQSDQSLLHSSDQLELTAVLCLLLQRCGNRSAPFSDLVLVWVFVVVVVICFDCTVPEMGFTYTGQTLVLSSELRPLNRHLCKRHAQLPDQHTERCSTTMVGGQLKSKPVDARLSSDLCCLTMLETSCSGCALPSWISFYKQHRALLLTIWHSNRLTQTFGRHGSLYSPAFKRDTYIIHWSLKVKKVSSHKLIEVNENHFNI